MHIRSNQRLLKVRQPSPEIIRISCDVSQYIRKKIMKEPHKTVKLVINDFERVKEKLDTSGPLPIQTPRGKKAVAQVRTTLSGSHQGEQFIKIDNVSGQEFARIYQDCWGFTTNCYGTYIGGYSDALDAWTGEEI